MADDDIVISHQKISDTEGAFGGGLADSDFFGGGLASLGDLDGDDVVDLAVGAFRDDDGGSNRGAVWILFMNGDGTVKSQQKISSTAGAFTGALDDGDTFGHRLAGLGDHDGDGVEDLATSSRGDDDGGSNRGAVWILFLNLDGTVKRHQEISATAGGFGGALDLRDNFGDGLAAVGDLDGDGVSDLAAGAGFDDDGGSDRGAVWLLFLNADGTVKSERKISDTAGGFDGVLDNQDLFGTALASVPDFDGDGTVDRVLVVGAHQDDDGGFDRGAVWLISLEDQSPPAIPTTGTIGLLALALGLLTLFAWRRKRTGIVGDIFAAE